MARWLPLLCGALLALLGLLCLLAPERASVLFGLFPSGAAGYGNLRGDLGAFFLGMAGFAVLGALRADRRLVAVPAVFLAAVLPGRLVSFAVDGRSASGLRALLVELVLIGLLLGGLRAMGNSVVAAAPLPIAGSRRWRRVGIGCSVLALLAIGAVALQRPIGMWLAAFAIDQRVGRLLTDDLSDGLHVGLCGSGSPLPDARRAGPCVFVAAGKHLYVVDAGDGSPRQLALMGLPLQLVDGILLTHFHSDHIGGLGEMMLQRWVGAGSATPVDVFGPQGVETVVDGFRRAYELDRGYRVAHHGAATMPPSGAGGVARPFEVPQGRDWSQVVLERDGLRITAFSVVHTPVFPAVGYRFDYAGRSVVVSGDTVPSAWLETNARGADVLFHEALQPAVVSMLHARAVQIGNRTLAKITADIPSYHTSPEDAARLAARAGVSHLVLHHAIPPIPTAYFNPVFLGDAPSHYAGPITVGRDGLLLSLPRGSGAILLRDLL